MPVFAVPLNYDETVDHLTVPICVSDVDEEGNRVHFEWIQHGVAPSPISWSAWLAAFCMIDGVRRKLRSR